MNLLGEAAAFVLIIAILVSILPNVVDHCVTITEGLVCLKNIK